MHAPAARGLWRAATARGGRGGGAPRRWKSTEVADASFLTEAEAALSRNPQLADTLVEHLSPEVRQRLMMAAVRADSSGAAGMAFAEADINKDGKLSPEEFQRWMLATAAAAPTAVSVSQKQIRQMALYTAVPMIGPSQRLFFTHFLRGVFLLILLVSSRCCRIRFHG